MWVNNCRKEVEKLRLIKSPGEIALMRQSCLLAAEAIKDTMRRTK